MQLNKDGGGRDEIKYRQCAIKVMEYYIAIKKDNLRDSLMIGEMLKK